MTITDNYEAPEHRYSLRSLMGLTTMCCIVAAVAAWIPDGLPIIVPPMIGPFVAWSIVPSWRSMFLGLFSAYFWTIPMLLTSGVAVAFVNSGNGVLSGFEIASLASATSIFGGYLGAMVERSRLQHLERQRIRKHRT